MNPRRKMGFACMLLWTILALVASSSGRPSDVNGETGNPNVVVPQVGVLEVRAEGTGTGNDTVPIIIGDPNGSSPGQSDGTIGNAGKGILVPIVSVNDGDSPKNTNGNIINPLVALLPAPLTSETQPPELPVSLPAKPEIRRSLTTGHVDRASDETMDVAEDIVFRPLFRIRQPAGRSSYYRPNYRRYNVNGYYRVPYNYFQS